MAEIKIVESSLTEVKNVIKCIAPPEKTFVVFDENVAEIVGRMGLHPAGTLGIVSNEENKTFDTVTEIDRWLMNMSANRDALVVGVGGGITTDMVGFAASIYKRGVRFAFVPTTLLAQVDASIGGKNGVNLDSFKNMLGIIRQPEATVICHEVLDTLPYREIVNGAAELLKTFIICNDGGNYEKSVAVLRHIQEAPDRSALGPLATAAAQVKAQIAGRDPDEHGERRLLNLGHTFAHAIEKESDETIPHGAAVSMGIILAARLSEAIGLASKGFAERLKADFSECGLPVDCHYDVARLASAMKKDKKAEGGIVHFVLPIEIGRVEVHDMSVEEAVCKLQ